MALIDKPINPALGFPGIPTKFDATTSPMATKPGEYSQLKPKTFTGQRQPTGPAVNSLGLSHTSLLSRPINSTLGYPGATPTPYKK